MTRRRLRLLGALSALVGGAVVLIPNISFRRTEPRAVQAHGEAPLPLPPPAGTPIDPETVRNWQPQSPGGYGTFTYSPPDLTADGSLPCLSSRQGEKRLPGAIVPVLFELDLSTYGNLEGDDCPSLAPSAQPYLASLKLRNRMVKDEHLPVLAGFLHLTSLDLSGTQVTDEGLKHLVGCKKLSYLSLNRTRITNNGLKYLDECTTLTGLDLSYTKVSDEGVKHLAGWGRCRSLSLGQWVTDEGLKHLAKMKELSSLDLSCAEVTDDGVKHLAGLTNLRSLSLSQTRVTDAGLESLTGLTELKRLDVVRSAVAGTGLKPFANRKGLKIFVVGHRWDVNDAHLKALSAIEMLYLLYPASRNDYHNPATKDEDVIELDLDRAPVTDEGLKRLGGLRNLKHIIVSRTWVTGAGLKHLTGLKNLERITHNGQVTDAEVTELRKLLPNCKIIRAD